jgi:type I restriction enzyme M protein
LTPRHLLGGIPDSDIEALADYWSVYPSLQKALFEPADRPGYSQLRVAQDEIKQTIFEHPEFVAYSSDMDEVFEAWKAEHTPELKAIAAGVRPRELIGPLAESILETYAGKSLIDQYDVYQHVLSYWLETMKDDVYMLGENGWQAEVTELVRKKGDKKVEAPTGRNSRMTTGSRFRSSVTSSPSTVINKEVVVSRILAQRQRAGAARLLTRI